VDMWKSLTLVSCSLITQSGSQGMAQMYGDLGQQQRYGDLGQQVYYSSQMPASPSYAMPLGYGDPGLQASYGAQPMQSQLPFLEPPPWGQQADAPQPYAYSPPLNSGQQAMPVRQQAMPVGQQAMPVGQQAMPAGQQAPAGQQTMPEPAPSPQPLPSPQEILAEKDEILAKFRGDVEDELQKAEVEAEQSKQECLARVDVQLDERKQEIVRKANEYAARLEQQSRDMLAKSIEGEFRERHRQVIASIEADQQLAQQELETQIQTAYEVARTNRDSQAVGAAVQAAKDRFSDQIAGLSARRNQADAELEQQLRGLAEAPSQFQELEIGL